MITRNHNPPINHARFKLLIKDMIFEKQQPQLELTGTEVNLWYNHPTLPKRLCHRMGMFKTNHFARQFFYELEDLTALVHKEWGL